MSASLPDLVRAPKTLPFAPEWTPHEDQLRFTSSLDDADGVTIEGLWLRGQCPTRYPDERVVYQLEYLFPGFRRGPVSRIEWHPQSPHNNKGLGPPHLRHIEKSGSQVHPFDLNWTLGVKRMVSENLPIGLPIEPEPRDFRAFTSVMGTAFGVRGVDLIPAPPWQPRIL
ncbi:hypothetical protein [Roseospira navarrensis]|uniref:Uncharacterized protein n=1 Tax=Roseospira navarrensis TaxID=140058 RepID=A0A7X1ZGL2_9PROT|nr:hypothetical protein [Roseospira navarrensis]MQX37953.1 hypothetical protein [Roseospira navarrensis]